MALGPVSHHHGQPFQTHPDAEALSQLQSPTKKPLTKKMTEMPPVTGGFIARVRASRATVPLHAGAEIIIRALRA